MMLDANLHLSQEQKAQLLEVLTVHHNVFFFLFERWGIIMCSLFSLKDGQ